MKAWKAHTKKTKPETIIEATRKQLLIPDSPLTRDPQYIPYPASWLNAGSYLNEHTVAAPEPARTYDRPARPQCSTCDSTGYISTEDEHGRWTATPCKDCK